MDFPQLIRSRKSIRSFSGEPVSRELLENILEVATYAPTNCNQQLWNFTIVDEADTKERLIKDAASNTLIRRAPVIIVVSYDGWNYKEAIQGGALAVGHILLAATEYGLGSLPMNSYGADSKIKKILHIPDNQTICSFVLLGYPDEKSKTAPHVPRRDVKEVVHWGRFRNLGQIKYGYNPEEWTINDLISHQQFYCRKTFLGKEMDIMSEQERSLIRRELALLEGSVVDYFSYDGAYLREFSEKVSLTTVDLCKETAEYTVAAAKLTGREKIVSVYDFKKIPPTAVKTNTILFKLERLPADLRKDLYNNVHGDLIIVARKRNVFLLIFFFILRVFFGGDIRKTGIYTFFGPYQPISLSFVLNELKAAGFKDIHWSGYFPLPAIYEQFLQMFLQYKASDGSSYLHRERRSNIATRLLSFFLSLQGLGRFGRMGSVVVIKCRK